jgi:hypothetical protein
VGRTSPRWLARSRRNLIRNLAFCVIVAGLVSGGGWYVVRGVQAGIAEQDLSLLGNGVPTVVQIHDPQCPRCRALKRETREAMSQFKAGTIQYLVANIRQLQGRRFAAKHRVGHITLLLFDGNGRRRGILAGERESEVLVNEFRKLIQASGKE